MIRNSPVMLLTWLTETHYITTGLARWPSGTDTCNVQLSGYIYLKERSIWVLQCYWFITQCIFTNRNHVQASDVVLEAAALPRGCLEADFWLPCTCICRASALSRSCLSLDVSALASVRPQITTGPFWSFSWITHGPGRV